MRLVDLAERIRVFQDSIDYNPANDPANIAWAAIHSFRLADAEAYAELIRLINHEPEIALDVWVRRSESHRAAERMIASAFQEQSSGY